MTSNINAVVSLMLATVFLFLQHAAMVRPKRQTLKTAPAKKAPMQIIALILPVWFITSMLSFFMPWTGVIASILTMIALFVLPFKAKKGACPNCGRKRLFPFSGFGGPCKGCGQDIVLRGNDIHLLEPRSTKPVPGSGRGNQPTRKD